MHTGSIEEYSIKFQQEMKMKRKQQKAVHKHCNQLLVDAERRAERESIALIEAYKKIEKHAYRKIEKERAEFPDRPIKAHLDMEAELETKILDLQSELLEIELKLQDALLVSRKQLFTQVKKIMDEMQELSQEYIANVNTEVVEFNEKFREAAIIENDKFLNQLQKIEQLTNEGDTEALGNFEAEQEAEKPGYLDMMMMTFTEQEALVTALEGFKEVFENKIQGVETTINNDIKQDWTRIEA